MTRKPVTIRASGKTHPAMEWIDEDGRSVSFTCCCRCPGSQNGSLANSARKIAEGHEAANCQNRK